MYINTTGLILRETAYKDSSKILTVLTGGEGKLTVTARGALRKNSKLTAVTQLLAFSEMTLFCSRDRWTLTEARSVEQFIGLRDDLALLALGAYFAELTEAVADEDSPNPELLPLCLNALFALSEKLKTPEHVKPVFELRLMASAGFAPLIERCAICGREDPEDVTLNYIEGTVRCRSCVSAIGSYSEYSRPGAPDGSMMLNEAAMVYNSGSVGNASLNRGALSAARYIISCDSKKLFSFTLGADALRELSSATEGYLLAHLDRRFRTLDYYKGIV